MLILDLFIRGDGTTYKQLVACKNCEVKRIMLIRKGMTVNEFCKNKPCFNCGCKQLVSVDKDDYY